MSTLDSELKAYARQQRAMKTYRVTFYAPDGTVGSVVEGLTDDEADSRVRAAHRNGCRGVKFETILPVEE